MKQLLLAFYGDDFTGSTDALEFICRAGAKAILFIEPPTSEQLEKYPDLDAFGVAGITRSLPPREMQAILLPAFKKIKTTGVRHVHYKVCSTFDSSPTVGSIGEAIDCGAAIFHNKTIPILGGMPALGRYCIFGNLYARMGTAGAGKIHRLDRHPSMSKHPVTPANESDLRMQLAKQTDKAIGLIDVLHLQKSVNDMNEDNSEEVVLIDVVYDDQLLKIGEWIDKQAGGNGTLFSVGSSGIELALGKHWNKMQLLKPHNEWAPIRESSPVLVVSGSCSPVTAAQINYAKLNGFEELVIDAAKIGNDEVLNQTIISKVDKLLQEQKNVIVHTGHKQLQQLSSAKLGKALGTIARVAAERSLVHRVIVAGGDTSSYAARAMEIEAVEMIASVVSGAPLCKAISSNQAMNGLEVNFKGGQVGGEDYFVLMTGVEN